MCFPCCDFGRSRNWFHNLTLFDLFLIFLRTRSQLEDCTASWAQSELSDGVHGITAITFTDTVNAVRISATGTTTTRYFTTDSAAVKFIRS